jgi:hypothetical protein
MKKSKGLTDSAWDYRRRVIRRASDANPSLLSCMREIEMAFKAGAMWRQRQKPTKKDGVRHET